MASCDDHHKIRSREIRDADIGALAEFLGKGLGYPSAYYLKILRLLGHPERCLPTGLPRYGYLLEDRGRIAGAILLIFTNQLGDVCKVRCHVTAWCVDPRYRLFGAVFFTKALNVKGVTYINISARPSARRFLELHGFLQYSNGQFVAVPVLTSFFSSNQAKVFSIEDSPPGHFEPFERDLLLDHSRYGCLSLWCSTQERAYPFVFQQRNLRGFIPAVQLVYCRDVEDLVRFSGPLGLFLAARGKLFVRIDANGPIPGLVGRYLEGKEPRYYKGVKPQLGDLAYTQGVMAPFVQRR